jgi:acetyl esterase/lipase
MSITSKLIKMSFKYGDALRDRKLQIPKDIVRLNNVYYYKNEIGLSKDNKNGNDSNDQETCLLDLYLPKIRENPLPIIVSIHGGGWVYGNKEAYQYYCSHLAQYGFAVINFNYRLAPKNKFPAALEDVNRLFVWLEKSYKEYDLDINNLFVVGDSAGGQLACQYAAIITNDDYAALFPFETPNITIQAMGLHSGVFHPVERVKELDSKESTIGKKVDKNKRFGKDTIVNRGIKDVMLDYLGSDILLFEKEMDFQSHINEHFPPVFIANSINDMVAGRKPEFADRMDDVGVQYIYKEYGHGDLTLGHVFHLNIKRKEAREFNKEQIEFFLEHIRK